MSIFVEIANNALNLPPAKLPEANPLFKRTAFDVALFTTSPVGIVNEFVPVQSKFNVPEPFISEASMSTPKPSAPSDQVRVPSPAGVE